MADGQNAPKPAQGQKPQGAPSGQKPQGAPTPAGARPQGPQGFGAPKPGAPPVSKDFKHIVRICNTDLDGNKSLLQGMRRIRGVSFMFANMTCKLTGVDAYQKAGNMSDANIKKIDDFLRNPVQSGAPSWMFNRRKDPETGADMHAITTDLIILKENDIKTMKKIRTYRGVRHMLGQPVRGQRTRSNFRVQKTKGSGGKLGVIRKKDAGGASKPAASEKKDKK